MALKGFRQTLATRHENGSALPPISAAMCLQGPVAREQWGREGAFLSGLWVSRSVWWAILGSRMLDMTGPLWPDPAGLLFFAKGSTTLFNLPPDPGHLAKPRWLGPRSGRHN